MKLNIGAGECWSHADRPWVNLDSRPSVFEKCPHLGVAADLMEFEPEEPVTEAYAGHVFEHIPLGSIMQFTLRLWDLLQPGGDLAVVGPDAIRSAQMYADGEVSWERHLSFGVVESEARFASYFNAGRGTALPPSPEWNPALHAWVCTGPRVAAILAMCGFTRIRILTVDHPDLSRFPVFDRGSQDQFGLIAHKM